MSDMFGGKAKTQQNAPLQEDPDQALLGIMQSNGMQVSAPSGGMGSATHSAEPMQVTPVTPIMSANSAPAPASFSLLGTSGGMSDNSGNAGMPPPPPKIEDPDSALLGVMKSNGIDAKPPPAQAFTQLTASAQPTSLSMGLSASSSAFPQPSPAQNLDPDAALLQVMHGSSSSSSGSTGAGAAKMPTLNDFVKQKTGHVSTPSSLLQTGDSLHELFPSLGGGSGAGVSESSSPPVDLSSVTVDEWMQMRPKQAVAAHSLSWHPSSDTDTQVSQLLEQVSQISGKSVTVAPTTADHSAAQQQLSSDLTSLLGLGAKPAPAFLQVAQKQRLHGTDKARAMHAAAALRAALGGAGTAGKRLAQVVVGKGAAASVPMLTQLKQSLEGRKSSWACKDGAQAQHAETLRRLTEQSLALINMEGVAAGALAGEVKGLADASTQRRTELVGLLEQTLRGTYATAATELHGAKVPKLAAAALLEFEQTLQRDAGRAHDLGQGLLSSQAMSTEAAVQEIRTTQAEKQAELKKQRQELAAATAAAAKSVQKAGRAKGCAEAAKGAGLLAAVDKALSILKA